MDIRVDIDAEAVNRQVSDAIIKSALGKKLVEAVDNAVRSVVDGSYTSNSIVQSVVREEIRRHIGAILNEEEFSTRVREVVREQLETHLTDTVLQSMFEKLWKDLT